MSFESLNDANGTDYGPLLDGVSLIEPSATVADLTGATATGLASIDNTVTPNILSNWFTLNFSNGGSAIAIGSDTRN